MPGEGRRDVGAILLPGPEDQGAGVRVEVFGGTDALVVAGAAAAVSDVPAETVGVRLGAAGVVLDLMGGETER